MENGTPVLARCAGCGRNFETRRYGQQACPVCHVQLFIMVPEGVTLPPEQPQPPPEPEPPQSAPSEDEAPPAALPWDNWLENDPRPRLKEFVPAFESGEHGFFSGFIKTIGEIFNSPAAFFASIRIGNIGLVRALFFGWLVCTASLVLLTLNLLWVFNRDHQALINYMQGKLVGVSPEDFLSLTYTGLYWTLYLSPLLGLCGILLSSGIIHLLFVFTTNNQRGYSATLRATAYGFTPLLLFAIPYVGQFLGGMWTLVLLVIALSQIHRTSPWRAALAVLLLPTTAIMLLYSIQMVLKGQL